MKIGQLTNRESMLRVASVAGYVAVVATAIAFTWSAISAGFDQRASVAAAETMLAELEGRSALGPRDQFSPLHGAPAGSPFLQGETLNVAAASLLQRVGAAVQRVNGNVLSSQVDLNDARSKQGWAGLVVSCEIEQASLQPLLYDIEAGMPFLFIDQLVIQTPSVGTKSNRMRIVLAVSGQWWSGK
ncbi:MAG: type II secretion system protein GspM [Xanthobacteraceae bacterium]